MQARHGLGLPLPSQGTAEGEELKGFPDVVVAVVARGRVTGRDCEEALLPRVEAALQRHSTIRCYYELGRDFADFDLGAMWENFRLGVEHLTRWDRIAIVTDLDWIAHATQFFRAMIRAEIRVFPNCEAPQARAWIADA
jgi:hypothetical protein